MDSQIFYRPKQETADYLEHALGRKSDYAHSSTSRQGGGESLGLSEQGVPLMSADEIKQLQDSDIVLFHANLRPVRARRMNWREHPVLRHRQAMPAPRLPPLPPLTTVALRRLQTTASDDLINPDEPFKRKR
jgi:type IV secretory pathway TraG/TraD family ATPase VirD4